jgi:hypothetical protein
MRPHLGLRAQVPTTNGVLRRFLLKIILLSVLGHLMVEGRGMRITVKIKPSQPVQGPVEVEEV